MGTTFRPLRGISQVLGKWALSGNACCTVQHSGRCRTFVNYVAIALGWMSKGYQYDDRSFMQRVAAGKYYWQMALAVVTFRDLAAAHNRYSSAAATKRAAISKDGCQVAKYSEQTKLGHRSVDCK